MFDFADVLLDVLKLKASDLHLTAGSPPMVREKGRLRALDYPVLTPQQTREIIYSILTNDQRKRLENDWQIDFAYSIRELGADAQSFALGLKAALRQDPDVILVGEMRDLETISTALTAAETGHLVFATLHTQDTPQTIDRIIDVFPPHQQQQVRVQLSVALQGIVTQQLLPTADGSGRVAGCGGVAVRPAP